MSMTMNRFGAIVAYLEDDCMISDTMVDIFEMLGCRTITAADGEAMLAQLAADHRLVPDIVVSDYHMPGDNGAIMISRIRAQLGIAVPAILLSGSGLTDEIQAQVPPDVPVLLKPVRMRMLCETFNRLGIATL
jgi:CheY-like chemotaxis protein